MASDAPDRCSLAAHARFAAFSRQLEVARGATLNVRDLPPTTRVAPRSPAARAPRFETLPRSEAKLDRQAAAARLNAGAAPSPFREPAAPQFRQLTPERWRGGRDFEAKFAPVSRQDLRRRTARSQEGFFGPAPGEDAPPVSHTFMEQMQQQQRRRLDRLDRLDRGEASPDGQLRTPNAFHLGFHPAPESPPQWPTTG